MSDKNEFQLGGCRSLLDRFPALESLRAAVEVIERTVLSEPGVAFTHCRGLLETACIVILKDRGVQLSDDPQPNWLMSETVKRLELTSRIEQQDKPESSVRDLLKGLNLLVNGVVGLRNSQGIGPHGRDALESVLGPEYAVLTARAVDVAVALLFGLHQEQLGREALEYFRYGTYPAFDAYLDDNYPELTVEEVPIRPSLALHHQDPKTYRRSLMAYLQGEREASGFEEGELVQEAQDG